MKDNKKKIAASGIALLVVAGITSSAALAYLSDGEVATNTFTIGDVSVEEIEPNYPGNDSDDVKDLVPNKEVKKDPQFDNWGVSDAIVFMALDSPMERVTIINDDGSHNTAKAVSEIFWFKDSSDPLSTHENNFDTSWQRMPAKEKYVKIASDGSETEVQEGDIETAYDSLGTGERLVKRYVFGYKTPIQGSSTHDGTPQTPENKITSALFDKVQLKNVVENEIDEAVEKIVVHSYAIQASNVLENSVDLATNLNEINLGKIYDIFIRQNSEEGDVTGLKINELRDIDDITPTSDGANGSEDPHINRWGGIEDVLTPGANKKPVDPATAIHGTWYMNYITYIVDGSDVEEIYMGYDTYVFEEDGTFKYTELGGTVPQIGTYSLSQNDGKTYVTISLPGEDAMTEEYVYRAEDEVLELFGLELIRTHQ